MLYRTSLCELAGPIWQLGVTRYSLHATLRRPQAELAAEAPDELGPTR
jgi:hypothetical protein